MRKNCLTATMLCAVLLAAGFIAGAAEAKIYRYASYVPPKHSLNLAIGPVLDEITKASKGRMEWKLFSSGQLFGARATVDGLGKGVADGSFIILNYFASQLPRAFTMVELSVTGGASIVTAAASHETMFFHCDECREDYANNNTLWLSGFAATPQVFLCNTEVNSMEDLKGLKIRTSGAAGKVVKAIGATPVGLTSAELYTGMERGQLDCVLGSQAWLISHRLMEKVKSVYHYPVISSHGLSSFTLSRQSWDAMSPEDRKLMVRFAPRAAAWITINGYAKVAAKAKAEAIKAGIKWVEAGPDMAAFMQGYQKQAMPGIIKRAQKRGMKDPERFITDHLKRVEAWKKRIPTGAITADAYEKMLWDEVYSKLDPEKL